MKINPFNITPSFKGANISITALSDTHGSLELTDRGYRAIINNDVFEKEEKGKANYLIIGGDWFISGGKTGFMTDPNKPLMKFQAEMLNKFIGKLKETSPSLVTIFTTGNHDLDGGVDLFRETIRDIDADTVISNLDTNRSYKLQDAINEGKIVTEHIKFIPDDKDPDIKHAILNLAIAPVNLQYFIFDHSGLELTEDNNIPQNSMSPAQFQKTKEEIIKKIGSFKEKYPKGKVILTCHTGLSLGDEIAKESKVDLVFDAHEHKDEIRFVNGTMIVCLSQNFKKIANAKMEIDDNGDTKSITLKELRPNESGFQSGELTAFYKQLFSEDLKKTYGIKSTDSDIASLSIDGIRNKNNYLANFVTDCIMEEIKEIDPEVRIFALNSSSIRNGFKLGEEKTVTPFEVLNCLNGINHKAGQIVTNKITGRELIYMILDNFRFNKLDPERNTIIHYSGLKIDKTGFMDAYSKGKIGSDLCEFVTLTDTNEQINPDETYKIANAEKYFIKAHDEKIKKMYENSSKLGAGVHKLFRDHFIKHPDITFTPDNRLT